MSDSSRDIFLRKINNVGQDKEAEKALSDKIESDPDLSHKLNDEMRKLDKKLTKSLDELKESNKKDVPFYVKLKAHDATFKEYNKLLDEILEKGEDYPVIFRLCADEFVEGGITLDYAKEVAKRLEDAGVDMLNVTGGNYDNLYYPIPTMYIEGEEKEAYYRFVKLASEIKKVVKIPVCSGGLILDPETAEKAIENDMVDMVFLGRQLIADPDWPRKVMSGKLDDVRPCIACNDGCLGEIFEPNFCIKIVSN